MSIWSGLFWKDTVERAVFTFAEALLALLVIAPSTNIIAFDWLTFIGVSATAAAIAVLKGVVANLSTRPSISPASLAGDGVK